MFYEGGPIIYCIKIQALMFQEDFKKLEKVNQKNISYVIINSCYEVTAKHKTLKLCALMEILYNEWIMSSIEAALKEEQKKTNPNYNYK